LPIFNVFRCIFSAKNVKIAKKGVKNALFCVTKRNEMRTKWDFLSREIKMERARIKKWFTRNREIKKTLQNLTTFFRRFLTFDLTSVHT